MDLRNTLSSVHMGTALLIREAQPNTRTQKILTIVKEGSDRADELLQELTTILSDSQPHPSPVDINHVIRQAVGPTPGNELSDAEITIPNGLPPASIYAPLIEEAIISLFGVARRDGGADLQSACRPSSLRSNSRTTKRSFRGWIPGCTLCNDRQPGRRARIVNAFADSRSEFDRRAQPGRNRVAFPEWCRERVSDLLARWRPSNEAGVPANHAERDGDRASCR